MIVNFKSLLFEWKQCYFNSDMFMFSLFWIILILISHPLLISVVLLAIVIRTEWSNKTSNRRWSTHLTPCSIIKMANPRQNLLYNFLSQKTTEPENFFNPEPNWRWTFCLPNPTKPGSSMNIWAVVVKLYLISNFNIVGLYPTDAGSSITRQSLI